MAVELQTVPTLRSLLPSPRETFILCSAKGRMGIGYPRKTWFVGRRLHTLVMLTLMYNYSTGSSSAKSGLRKYLTKLVLSVTDTGETAMVGWEGNVETEAVSSR